LTVALVCARIRSDWILKRLLRDPLYYSFVKGQWARKVYTDVLLVKLSRQQLKGMSLKTKLEHIYLFGVDQQFEDVGDLHNTLKSWDAALQLALRPPAKSQTALEKFALEWLRHRCLTGKVLACEKAVLRLTLYCGHEEYTAEAPTTLQDVLTVATTEELSAATVDSLGDLCVFRIVNLWPNRRVLEWPSHMGGRPQVIAITLFDTEQIHGRNSGVSVRAQSKTAWIDLRYWCQHFSELLQSLWTFSLVKNAGQLRIRQDCLDLLSQLHDTHDSPTVSHDLQLSTLNRGEIALPVLRTTAFHMFHQLFRTGSFEGSSVQRFLEVRATND
jgi:hypothetical protein